MARACPYPRNTRGEQEAHGKPRMGNVSMEEPTTDAVKTSRRMKISELRQELHRAELEEAIEEAGGVLWVLRPVVAN